MLAQDTPNPAKSHDSGLVVHIIFVFLVHYKSQWVESQKCSQCSLEKELKMEIWKKSGGKTDKIAPVSSQHLFYTKERY